MVLCDLGLLKMEKLTPTQKTHRDPAAHLQGKQTGFRQAEGHEKPPTLSQSKRGAQRDLPFRKVKLKKKESGN